MSNNIDIKLKIVLIGDADTNKTSLISKYVDNYFPESHMASIGVTYKTKTIIMNNIKITLNIWDTAGQERFTSITRSFINNTDGFMFLYDITNMRTFQNIKSWIKEIELHQGDIKSIIVGNNCHLENKREVKKEILNEYCNKKNIKGIEVSSKEGTNVSECFEMLVKLIIEDKTKEELIEKYSIKQSNLSISKNKKKEKKCLII